MAKALKSGHLYEFGPFRLDTAECLLRRQGEVVPLTPKLFDLLRLLVENGGRLLDKDELLQQVWPDTFIEESSLTRNISALRKALGEGADGVQYIETVPKRGYRFVAGVREVGEGTAELTVHEHSSLRVTVAEEQEVAAAQRAGKRAGGRRARVLVAGALAVGLVIAVLWLVNRPRQPAPGAPIKALAVLPFKPLAADRRDEVLEMGMADTLIGKLSHLRQIIIRPISAVRQYAALDQDPLAAGREQRVEAVLDGSIQKSGDQVRVTARLLRVADGAPLWTFQCHETCTDLFELQDAIAERIARELALTLTSEVREALTKRYTGNKEAYLLYLYGQHFLSRRTEGGSRKAIEYFEQALAVDPNYALAYVGVADSYIILGVFSSPPRETFPQAREAAVKALEIDEGLAEAHTSLAWVRWWYEWDWPGAEKEFNRAIELNPNYPTAHHWYGEYLLCAGRQEEAFAAITRARDLHPLSVIINARVEFHHYIARQYDQAIEQCRKTIEMVPDHWMPHQNLHLAYEQKGMYEEAFAESLKQHELGGASPEALAADKKVYAELGWTGYKRHELKRLLAARAKREYVAPHKIARHYAQLGDKERAFAWLEKTFDERDGFLVYLKVDPRYDSLHADPRIADLLRRVGLPQ